MVNVNICSNLQWVFLDFVILSVLSLRGSFGPQIVQSLTHGIEEASLSLAAAAEAFHPVNLAQRCLFPPKRALQDDCGKLIVLGELLHRLKSEGHKCIVFTQVDILLRNVSESNDWETCQSQWTNSSY